MYHFLHRKSLFKKLDLKLFFGAGALLFIPVERGLIDVTLAIDLFGPRLRWKIAWHFLKIYIQTIYYRVYQRFRLIKRDNYFQVIFKHVHSVPVNRTVRLTGTSLLNSLTGLPVVRISNFVYSIPVNQTPVNRTVRITGNPIWPSGVAKIGSNLKSTYLTKLSLSKYLTHALFIDFSNRVGLKSQTTADLCQCSFEKCRIESYHIFPNKQN